MGRKKEMWDGTHRKARGRNGTSAARQSNLSACLIVKDEQDALPRCLNSIEDVADEIIVVDTGSSDRTIEIAEEFGCQVHHFSWTGDFSAARNESIKHAEKDWILIIDADEELPAGEGENVRRAIDQPGAAIVSLTVLNKSPETDRVSSSLPSVRLFRRELGLQYEGIVHNRLSLPSDAPVMRSDITLYHYGYDLSPDKLREKRRRSHTLMEKQLADDPNDVFANFNMAQLLIGLHGTGDTYTCERILEHARRVIEHADSGNTGHIGYRLMAHHQMAIALSALGRYDEAEKYCRDALEKKDDYIDAILTLANICLAKADLDAARAQYERFLSAVDSYRPRHECHDIIMHYLLGRHIARYGLATIYRLQGMIDEALKEYYAVLRECPAYLDTRYQAGMLHLRRGEPARAEDIVKQGLESDPDSIPLLIAMARAVEAQGRGDRAVAWLETALVRAPRDSDVMLALAKTLMRLGRRDDGGHYLKEMLAADPANPRAAFAAAGVYFDLGEYERARTLYRLSLEHNPFWPEAYTNLGNCFYKQEHYEAARAAYETALALSPDSGLARRNLALTYARRSEYDRALAIIGEHTDEEPATIDMQKLTGDLLFLSGRYAEAIDRYERHLSAHPGDTDCLFHIAEAYRKSGHVESAAAGYRHILKIAPDHKPAAQRLELVENVAPAN